MGDGKEMGQRNGKGIEREKERGREERGKERGGAFRQMTIYD